MEQQWAKLNLRRYKFYINAIITYILLHVTWSEMRWTAISHNLRVPYQTLAHTHSVLCCDANEKFMHIHAIERAWGTGSSFLMLNTFDEMDAKLWNYLYDLPTVELTSVVDKSLFDTGKQGRERSKKEKHRERQRKKEISKCARLRTREKIPLGIYRNRVGNRRHRRGAGECTRDTTESHR